MNVLMSVFILQRFAHSASLCLLRAASPPGWTRCEGRGTTAWWRGSTGNAVASAHRTDGRSTSTGGRYPSTPYAALLCFCRLDCLGSRPSHVTRRRGAPFGCRRVASGFQGHVHSGSPRHGRVCGHFHKCATFLERYRFSASFNEGPSGAGVVTQQRAKL